MSDPAIDVDRLLDLADLACEETASDDEFAELDACLVGNPMFRRRYLNYCRIHIGLGLQFRAHRATQAVCRQIGVRPSVAGSSELGNVKLDAFALPTPTFPTSLWHGTVGFLSSGWPAAYLISTVICGVSMLIGSLVHVSEPAQLARQSSVPSRSDVELKTELVGRITGMVDCKWVKNPKSEIRNPKEIINQKSKIINPKSLVSLGDRFAIASGLMEITYDSGAKVILQGPVTYEVESASGGYLSVGKLTARLERKVASGQWLVASTSEIRNQKSEISNPQSLIPNPPSLSTIHYPLFTIKTPTATVTDLGTEFGVEVSDAGITTSHVFQGLVDVQFVHSDRTRGQAIRLAANQSVRVDKQGTMTRQPPADRAAFVRSLRQQPAGKEIPVDNGGFERPALAQRHGVDPYGGWYNQDADSPAAWQKIGIAGVVAGGNAPIRPNVTDGGQWGFCNGKSEFNPISGVLYRAIATIDAAKDYVVSADVAVQTHWGQGIAYKLSLWAGAGKEPVEELASVAGTAWVNPRQVQVICKAARHAAYAGQKLFVRFECTEDEQVLIDNVRVRVSDTLNSPQVGHDDARKVNNPDGNK